MKNFEDYESFKNFIALRFARIRLAHNIPASKLSLNMGQSREYINQIENGRKMPSMQGLFNFCNYFNISFDEFFDSEQAYPIEYKDIIQKLNMLDETEIKHISTTISLIAKNK